MPYQPLLWLKPAIIIAWKTIPTKTSLLLYHSEKTTYKALSLTIKVTEMVVKTTEFGFQLKT